MIQLKRTPEDLVAKGILSPRRRVDRSETSLISYTATGRFQSGRPRCGHRYGRLFPTFRMVPFDVSYIPFFFAAHLRRASLPDGISPIHPRHQGLWEFDESACRMGTAISFPHLESSPRREFPRMVKCTHRVERSIPIFQESFMVTVLNKYSSRIAAQVRRRLANHLYGTGLTGRTCKSPRWASAACGTKAYLQHAPERSGAQVRKADAAGLVGMRFNTIGVSDGISMGTGA